MKETIKYFNDGSLLDSHTSNRDYLEWDTDGGAFIYKLISADTDRCSGIQLSFPLINGDVLIQVECIGEHYVVEGLF